MLLVTPDDQRYALSQAAEARERAGSATTDEDRRFWLAVEIRWNDLAESHAFVHRLNDFSHSIETTH